MVSLLMTSSLLESLPCHRTGWDVALNPFSGVSIDPPSIEGEVPIGALVVKNDEIIGTGHNQKEKLKDTTKHAEIIAIQNASKTIGDWRLSHSTLYTNIEPCIMCCGAILHSRISKVVFCACEPKFGGVVSQAKLFDIKTSKGPFAPSLID